MSKSPEVLSTKEVLLDHLFAVIKPLVPECADKVVGMLVESSERHLMTILGNTALLKETVDEAVKCLKSCQAGGCEQSLTDEKGILGNELFDGVAQIEPGLCAQITGMMLEMDTVSLRTLLMDKESFSLAVEKAKHEYITQHQHKPPVLADEVAELLYEAVTEVYDKNAAKITGMLAELPTDEIKLLLKSPTQFKQMIELCRESLENTHQWITE